MATTLLLQCRRLCTDASQLPRRMARRVASQCKRDCETVPTEDMAAWAQSTRLQSLELLRWWEREEERLALTRHRPSARTTGV